MPVYSVSGGTTGYPSDLDQFTDTFNGANDTDITLLAQISPPSAPTVAVNTTAGNLTGNYQYAIAFVTGYWQGPVGSGTFYSKGNTGGGTASTTVSPNAQQVNLSNIPIGPTGVYERIIYRTDANGANFYYLTTLADNTTTTYTDDTADSGLGAAMPTANTTGGKFSGDGSGLTNLPITPVSDATTTSAGIVEIPQTPSGTPISPVRVADQEEIELTTTSATTVATFTPTGTGFFEIACHFSITATTNVTIAVTYANASGATTTTILNTTSYTYASGGDNDYDTIPVTIKAVSGTAIDVKFTASVASAVTASANIVGR